MSSGRTRSVPHPGFECESDNQPWKALDVGWLKKEKVNSKDLLEIRKHNRKRAEVRNLRIF